MALKKKCKERDDEDSYLLDKNRRHIVVEQYVAQDIKIRNLVIIPLEFNLEMSLLPQGISSPPLEFGYYTPWNYNLEMSLLYLGDKFNPLELVPVAKNPMNFRIPKLYRLRNSRPHTYPAAALRVSVCFKERCEPVTEGAPSTERTTFTASEIHSFI
ncbi:hypothetical protein NQ317_011539 [Molorchus minor]|uniref:Uncharacterized protein n=1 Tax=Molorchus minor TaxID=1323400 RepID=A0ABQ9K5B8_9CUCU|nr:hypothetical protein NQ317_011539 [Molorchus minor]